MKEKFFKAVISFITGAILAAVILALAGIYPGSETTLLIFDMREQFVSFYSSLKALFNENASFFYTFQGSLGTPFIGMFAYYLASPFSFITLLFDTHDLPDAIWLMDILKCGSMCAAFSVFMDFRGLKNRFFNLSLSLCYGLSSAAVTFFILPMYSDTLIWLPVICIFLGKFLKYPRFKNGILYSVFLSACMYTHFYSAYMVCVFLVFYTVFILVETDMELKDVRTLCGKYVLFVLYSLLAALMALPLFKTVITELSAGKVYDSGVYSDGGLIVTNPLELLKQFICGHYGYLYSEGAPAVYFTVIALGFSVYGIYTLRKYRARTIISCAIIMVFVLSFIFRPFYRIWHMFRDPVAYPHRFAFLFVFFMLVLAGDGIESSLKKRYLPVSVLTLSVILLIINGSRITSMEISTLPGVSRSDYEIFIDTTGDLVEAAKSDCERACGSTPDITLSQTGMSVYPNNAASQASFCRINKDFELTSNDPMLLGFNGIDYFSSVYDPGMLTFYKNMGFLQYHYKSCDAGDTILTGMVLGTDYMIHKGFAESGYEMITSNGFATLSRNPYSLGCGYLGADDNCKFGTDPFANQNSFVNSVVGFDINLLTPLKISENTETFSLSEDTMEKIGDLLPETLYKNTIEFIAPSGKNIYLNFEILNEYELDYKSKANSRDIYVCMDGEVIASFNGYQKAYNIYVGNFNSDKKCVITVEGSDTVRKPYVYALDTEKMQVFNEEISAERFIAEKISPGEIIGKVNTIDNMHTTLIFTISYSDHFEVLVDGRKAETKAYAGALLSVPGLEIGEHEVSVRYR